MRPASFLRLVTPVVFCEARNVRKAVNVYPVKASHYLPVNAIARNVIEKLVEIIAVRPDSERAVIESGQTLYE